MISVSAAPASALTPPRADAARSIKLSESGHLHRTSGTGRHLNGQGTLTGTIHAAVYIHLQVGSGQTFTAEVNEYSRGGSLSGRVAGRYELVGGSVRFSGSLSISRGTGRYAHSRAHGLSFKGAVQLVNDAVTVRLSGTLRY